MSSTQATPEKRNIGIHQTAQNSETPMPSPSGGKRKIVLPVVIVAALIAVGWGGNKWMYSRAHESTDNAQIDGDITPVLAKVGGYITSVAVRDNEEVKAGQVLVTIDDQEYRVRLAQAEADLAAARAAVGIGSDIGAAQAQVATAASQSQAVSAQIEAARAADVHALADLNRMKDLADKQIVSRQQLDAAQASADAAHAQFIAAQKQATAAGAQVSNAQAGVKVAQAKLAAAQAAVDNAKLQLSYTKIVAPAAGFVARKQVEVGQLVSPGQPLLSVVSDTSVWVTANFKETQLSNIQIGQPVAINVDAYGGCSAEGKVESVSGATGAKFALLPPDNATGNFTKVVQRVPVKIAITKSCPGRVLRPGLSVDAHVKVR